MLKPAASNSMKDHVDRRPSIAMIGTHDNAGRGGMAPAYTYIAHVHLYYIADI